MRDGWVETKLGEICEIYQPKTIAKSLMKDSGKYIVYGANGPIGRFDEYNHENSEVVVTCRGATCGTVNKTPKKTWITGNAMVVLPKNDSLLKDFLYLSLISFVDLKSCISGSAQPQITREGLSPQKVLIPPLAEQKRIVDLISSVDSYIEALQQQVAKARKSRNAVLHELLTKGGDDWVETKLGEICEIYQPKTIAKSLMKDSGKYIVYGANGPIGRFDEYNHENSEVVVTCRGATCGTVNKTPKKTWITGNAMVVLPKNDSLLKDFLYLSLISFVDLKSCISGSAQPQITREGLSPQKVLIPPLAEQKRIVEIISTFDNQINALEQSLNKSKCLRSALLSDLLSGKHEIPTNYDKLIGAA